MGKLKIFTDQIAKYQAKDGGDRQKWHNSKNGYSNLSQKLAIISSVCLCVCYVSLLRSEIYI